MSNKQSDDESLDDICDLHDHDNEVVSINSVDNVNNSDINNIKNDERKEELNLICPENEKPNYARTRRKCCSAPDCIYKTSNRGLNVNSNNKKIATDKEDTAFDLHMETSEDDDDYSSITSFFIQDTPPLPTSQSPPNRRFRPSFEEAFDYVNWNLQKKPQTKPPNKPQPRNKKAAVDSDMLFKMHVSIR